MDEPKELIFHDITDASEFAPQMSIPLWWIMIGLGILIVLISLGILLARKYKPLKNQACPYEKATDQIEKIDLDNQPLGQTASQLSLLLRDALQKETDSPSLFQSQQEFFTDKKLPLKNNELANSIIKHLNNLWKYEYAPPQQNVEQATSLKNETQALLQQLTKER